MPEFIPCLSLGQDTGITIYNIVPACVSTLWGSIKHVDVLVISFEALDRTAHTWILGTELVVMCTMQYQWNFLFNLDLLFCFTGRYKKGEILPDPKTWKANFRCAMNSLPDIEEVKDKSISKGSSAVRVYRMLPPSAKSQKKGMKRKRMYSLVIYWCGDFSNNRF